MQKQDPNITNPIAVRRETFIPGAHVHEHRAATHGAVNLQILLYKV